MSIKLYWCRGKGRDDSSQQNFGDYLSPLVVEMLAKKTVVYAPIQKAELMAIGSIMNREQKARRFMMPRRLHVWGAGTDSPDCSFSGRHYYHAVRGFKTREQITSLKGDPALGDPGLLANHWWDGRPRPQKRFKVGIIPHYVDHDNQVVRQLSEMPGVNVINVFWPVEQVLKSIQECEFIISSSMHGLIVADSFGVPNRRVKFSEGKISDYKFVDYYSVFGMEEPPCLTAQELLEVQSEHFTERFSGYSRSGLENVQKCLIKSFPFA
ncbi:polysaccharide pyruvyl transferase family protein [Pseudomonas mohnii]|uniref:polysaccharide pyruvyl transferase family protein n=1 Tax=Pseudomonas mohnii TaxID=395600 RepID=UPI0018C81D75|nr:polysaccharide pyruvyl transferase family protein [Pseudomonas mohnii]MBH8611567.1 polysaccharide pyruvyl transferase family protein [Pseudomonas mohnii]